MYKKILIYTLLCGGSINVVGQSEVEQLKEQILAYQKCVEEKSLPDYHHVKRVLSNGKIINVAEQTDFFRYTERFTSVDAFLENPEEWVNSVYMSQVKKGSNKGLIDTNGLSEWEVNNIRAISNEYFKSTDNTFHIVAHGLINPHGNSANKLLMGGQELNAKEIGELILQTMEGVNHILLNAAEKPFVIVLHSCNSAEGENSFAQQLSAELSKSIDNVAVVGAPDAIYCEMDEKGNYTEKVSSISAIKRNQPERKNWLVFQNGKEVIEGTADYKTTVKTYLNKYK